MKKRITNLGAIGLALLGLHTIALAQITNPLAQPAQTNFWPAVRPLVFA